MRRPADKSTSEPKELPKLATLPERLQWAFTRAALTGSRVAAMCGLLPGETPLVGRVPFDPF
jgi:hypothetical protein